MTDVRLTQANANSLILVSPGDTITVALEQTASTGYRWTVDNGVEPVLSVQGNKPGSSPAVGGAGTVEWSFRAIQSGTATLRLKLWRAWEGDASVIETLEMTVHVR